MSNDLLAVFTLITNMSEPEKPGSSAAPTTAAAPATTETPTNNSFRTVFAYIRDQAYEINIADGSQTVDWLADVVLFKYRRNQFEKLSCRGVKYHNNLLNMDLPIASQVEDRQDVYILLDGDEDVDQMFGDEI